MTTSPNDPTAAPVTGHDVIVVGLDDSPHAALVLGAAIDQAKRRPGATLHLVHVVDEVLMPAPSGPLSTAGEVERLHGLAVTALAAASERVTSEAACAVHVHTPVGSARDTLLEEARRLGATLIVVGTHGRTGLSHLLLGSVAEQIVRHARCPVLVVPRAGT